jgi:hypothetical protein
VIEESLQKEIGRKDLSLDTYLDGVQETMNYVQKNVSSEIPYGISKEDYLMMMNKKVYSIILPIIKKDMEEKINIQIKNSPPTIVPPRRMISMNTQMKENFTTQRIQPTRQDDMFDPILMKNYENIPIADYPSPSDKKVHESQMNEKMDQLKMDRESIYSKPKKVSFQDEMTDSPKGVIDKMYVQRKEEYQKQSSSISHFEDFQNSSNEEVEEVVRNRNEYDAIPIDLFVNQKGGDIQELFKKKKEDEKNESQDIGMYGKDKNTSEMDRKPYYQNETLYQREREAQIFDMKLHNQKNGNSQSVPFSPYSQTPDPLRSVILPANIDTNEKKYRIMINSLDRNKYLFPSQNEFEIKFNPSSQSYRVDTYVDSYGELIYNSKEI